MGLTHTNALWENKLHAKTEDNYIWKPDLDLHCCSQSKPKGDWDKRSKCEDKDKDRGCLK